MCLASVLVLSLLALAPRTPAADRAEDAFLGRWDLTISGGESGEIYPSWLEVTREGEALKARFVARTGSMFTVPDVAIENGELKFQFTRGTPATNITYRARLEQDRLKGTVTGAGPPRSWTGVRAPVSPKTLPAKKPGKPVALFNGQDLSGWLPQDPRHPLGWVVRGGLMDNQGRANNIYSESKFSDFKVEVEFNMAPGSNSGVYLRGRYEVQILDDFGKPADSHGSGAIYGFITPRVNAAKPGGEWQTLEATLVANRVTVILNGIKIIENEEIPGITGGALNSQEAEPGPILLQGDHGPVQFRKVVVTPLE